MQTDLNHNRYMIKVRGVPAATRSRAFFLWLCLLGLYFLLVPTAADQRPMASAERADLLVIDGGLRARALPLGQFRYYPRP